ncbi:MAG: glycosyltransferase family 2 protein [Candidatus Electrothrix sp. EH2]|nr:glycosyltransferase family 2 protein [Candidatus Electrothrix sp. EH2]
MKYSDPYVSIIIPAYNYGHALAEAIDSCLEQTFEKCEVIVVNDGSTDCTDQVARKYEKINRINYISQKNQGVACARNNGARIARGDWLLFLDADDTLDKNAVSHLVSCANNPSIGVIFGKTLQCTEGESRLSVRYNKEIEGDPPHPAKKNFLKSLITTPGAAIVRKDIFQQVRGFKPGLHPAEDRHFWLKCGTITPFEACDQNIVLKKKSEKSASSDINRMIYKGLQVQLDYISWCQERNINTSFISYTQQEIVELSIKKAIINKKWLAFKAVLLHARFCNIYPLAQPVLWKFTPILRILPPFTAVKIVFKILRS